ncbi:MAG: PEP-CTERM sorting domain-containing protein [Pseudomonadota bacterium]
MSRISYKKLLLPSLVASFSLMSSANAAPDLYPNSGTPNAALYSFTAQSNGNLIAYYTGSGASFESDLSLLVNGVDTGVSSLNNHTSSYGQTIDFGNVNAGDNLVFRLNVLTTGEKWFSNAALNTDGGNHIYSNTFAGDADVPAGISVAFEDLDFNSGSDYNYNDENFVFTNVQVSPAPEPETYALMVTGLGLVGAMTRRKQKTA